MSENHKLQALCTLKPALKRARKRERGRTQQAVANLIQEQAGVQVTPRAIRSMESSRAQFVSLPLLVDALKVYGVGLSDLALDMVAEGEIEKMNKPQEWRPGQRKRPRY